MQSRECHKKYCCLRKDPFLSCSFLFKLLNEVSLPQLLVRYSLWPLLNTKYFTDLFNLKYICLLYMYCRNSVCSQTHFLKRQQAYRFHEVLLSHAKTKVLEIFVCFGKIMQDDINTDKSKQAFWSWEVSSQRFLLGQEANSFLGLKVR